MSARMPARGDRSAPTFDPTKPRELKRYFSDLEFLFAGITGITEDDKKLHTTRYVSIEVADIWETLAEFEDPLLDYSDFKKAIQDLYPAADDEYRYTMTDMDCLIGNRQRSGIHSLGDLAEYHSQFLAITKFLISKEMLSEIEQKRAYVRGFPTSVWSKIEQRLQLKFLDHLPGKPYPIADVQAAARFVLHGTHNIVANTPSPAASATPSKPSDPLDGLVKTEQLGSIFSEFTKSVLEAINANNQTNQRPRFNTSGENSVRDFKCNFCNRDHLIRNCELVEEYIRAGKVKRNIEGKVVLPTGAFVPRDVPGNFLKERIDEWHRRNPGQLAAATISANMLGAIQHGSSTPITSSATHPTYQFTADDRIASLEAELFSLRARDPNFKPFIRTRAQKADAANRANQEATQSRSATPEPQPAPQTHRQHDNAVGAASSPSGIASSEEEPEHPFRNARDANYLPPQARNIGTQPKVTPKKSEPAYRTAAPIYDAEIADNIYNRSLEAPVTLTQRELLSIAPDVRAHYRDATTGKRTTTDRTANTNILSEDRTQERRFNNLYSMPAAVALVASQHRSPPEGTTIVEDTFDQYYRSLRPGESPDPSRLSVAKESAALRSIFPIIDNSLKVECILDPGSQIIAMSEEVCHELSLIYDPSIKLNMQSANGTVDQSLGLARNVPFRIGGLTLYMQVHVIRAPAYDVLLGRPFDILTESVVRNFSNEDQTITVADPNTGKIATIPTMPRGPPRFLQNTKEGFRSQRI